MRLIEATFKAAALAVSSLLLFSSFAHSAVPPGGDAKKAVPAPVKAPAAPRAKASPTRRGLPDVRSSSVLVIDANDSAVLFSRHANVAAPIASITKLMTALVVLDGRQPLSEMLEITQDDRVKGRGAASRLGVGTKLSRGDFMHVALMSSDNRAAHVIARSFPGGVPAFVRAMNAKAQALGMTSAHFADPTGLSELNVASAEDLCLLVSAASRNPMVRQYSTDHRYSVMVGKRVLEFRNTNTLVAKADWNILVQKTGFTNEAGQCLVMKAVIKDRTVVIVLLDSFGKYTRVADARRIRKWLEAREPDRGTPAVADRA